MGLSVDIEKKLPGFELKIKFDTDRNVLGLLGASGSGKSMTLRCISGLETPAKGKIVLNDSVLFDSEKGINVPSRKRRVGFVFQNYALFPHMTVAQNIGFALKNIKKNELLRVIDEKIHMMHLEGLENRYPHQLSGGQQQRVALARTLAVEPEVLLLDEPFSALDEHLRGRMMDQMLESLAEYRGVTLFVSHNIEEAYRICDNMMILANGKMEAYGEKEEIFKNPPSLAAAQITGCKNISKAGRVSENTVEALEWGCVLQCHNPPDRAAHVGIREHDIVLADEKVQENVYSCWPCFTNETPFRVTICLSLGKPPSGRKDYDLQWEVTKQEWLCLKDMPQPWRIFLNPDKLFFMVA